MICPRLLKYLAAFCMLNCAGAATLPSAPAAPKFVDDKTTVLFATMLPPSALALTLALFP